MTAQESDEKVGAILEAEAALLRLERAFSNEPLLRISAATLREGIHRRRTTLEDGHAVSNRDFGVGNE